MKILILLSLLSIAVNAKDGNRIYYAHKKANSTSVYVPLGGFNGKTMQKINSLEYDAGEVLWEGGKLSPNDFKEIGSRDNDRFVLIGEKAKYMGRITGYSDSTYLRVHFVSLDNEQTSDIIQFDRFELYHYSGADGDGWVLTSKFKLTKTSPLYSIRSDRKKNILATADTVKVSLKNAVHLDKEMIPLPVSLFHERNSSFQTKHWNMMEAQVTGNTSYETWLERWDTRIVQKMLAVQVFSSAQFNTWYISLCALPSKGTYSQAAVLDSTGRLLKSNLKPNKGSISDIYGTFLVNNEGSVVEAVVCQVDIGDYNSKLMVLVPTENGNFKRIFSYWNVRD